MTELAAGDASPHLERDAAAWGWRRELGLTAVEERALAAWLAEDPRRGAELARLEAHWRRLDPLLPPRRRPRRRGQLVGAVFGALAVAAGVAGIFAVRWRPASAPAADTSPPEIAEIEDRTLADGSRVELNRGAVLAFDYGPAERRVALTAGEAQFQVAKDAHHPFIVDAAGIRVRAVGTVFDVRLGPRDVTVVVTEGTVRVAGPGSSGRSSAVFAGERLAVPRQAGGALAAPVRLSPEALRSELAWQPVLLNFTGTPLSEIVREFNRHNPVQLVVNEPDLGRLRLTARLRSDNVSGFVRMLESGCEVRAERGPGAVIVLEKVR